jgi:hypothetical protein
MTTPCSAWCRPDEGVHVTADYATRPAEEIQHAVGAGYRVEADDICMPRGALHYVLAINPAPEMPKRPGLHAILMTSQLDAIDDILRTVLRMS